MNSAKIIKKTKFFLVTKYGITDLEQLVTL